MLAHPVSVSRGEDLCRAWRRLPAVLQYPVRSRMFDLPNRCNTTLLKKRPSDYSLQLYFDSLVFTPQALRHLVQECGASQIVIGTDYPHARTSTAVDHILRTPSLSGAERVAILGNIASALLGMAT
jgi:predicted TIM-barrel fold metal-dependent hydrolase